MCSVLSVLFHRHREVIKLYVAKTRLNVVKVYLCKVYRICASTSTRGIRVTLRLEMALGQGAVLRGSRV